MLDIYARTAHNGRMEKTDRRHAGQSSLTAAERSLRARAAANARWANADRTQGTEAARQAFLARFEDQVDPGRRLPAAERARRVDHAIKSHMQRLALKRHATKTPRET